MENAAVLGANSQYVQQTKDYGKKDALLAFILYIFMLLEYLLMGLIFVKNSSNLTETFIFCITGISSLIYIGLVFIFCKMRKQNLATVGFGMNQAKKSLMIGMIFLLVTFVLCGIWISVTDYTIRTDVKVIAMRIIYFLFFIGFTEELLFRGYIGTRLYGYFSNKKRSIAVVGIMFSLMHIPFQMTIARMNFVEYILSNWTSLIYIAILHCGFQWLYAKYNSIIAPTILHFIIDFIQWFII